MLARITMALSQTELILLIAYFYNQRIIESKLLYLFNGIPIPYGLFSAEILFICKCLIVIITQVVRPCFPTRTEEK